MLIVIVVVVTKTWLCAVEIVSLVITVELLYDVHHDGLRKPPGVRVLRFLEARAVCGVIRVEVFLRSPSLSRPPGP